MANKDGTAAASRAAAAMEATGLRRQPAYHVVILDDDDHSYGYVVEMLGRLFGHSRQRAWRLARRIDTDGKAIVDTTTFERAEFKQVQIREYGPDWRVDRPLGSMAAIIVPAPT